VTFPAQIKQLRLALHLTQVELGALLDVSAQSICNWERGRSLPWEKDREGYLAVLQGEVAQTKALLSCALGSHRFVTVNPSKGSGDTATIQSRPRRRIGDDL
jgi:transcriptional regulator with XRE-family HTH domain